MHYGCRTAEGGLRLCEHIATVLVSVLRVFNWIIMKKTALASSLLLICALHAADPVRQEFKVLATSKTSTMEKEMNEMAGSGFSFAAVMGGETAFGGKEVVVVMEKSMARGGQKTYKLLAANKTSTLEKEMQAMGAEGFEYKGQTVFESAFGGREVALIMERDQAAPAKRNIYKLLATSKTSTMQKELSEVGQSGFHLLGMTVSKTAFGGSEVVCILRQND